MRIFIIFHFQVLSSVIALALGSPEANAAADAHYGGYGLGVAAHPGYGTSYVGRTVYGYPSYRNGKRSAEAEPHGVVGHVHGLGVAGHPGHASSYVGRTIYGYPSHHYGKRFADAEADADAHYGGYGYGRYAYGSPYGYGYRRGHYYGKRSAEADPEADAHYGAYGYGGYAYGVPGGYTRVSGLAPYGYGR